MSAPWKAHPRVGWALGILPSLMMIGSGGAKVAHVDKVVENWAHFGFPASTLTPIGVVELLCVVLYLVPKTQFFGLGLAVAYLGGATATHVHAGEPFFPPVIVGLLLAAGYLLRRPDVLGAALDPPPAS